MCGEAEKPEPRPLGSDANGVVPFYTDEDGPIIIWRGR